MRDLLQNYTCPTSVYYECASYFSGSYLYALLGLLLFLPIRLFRWNFMIAEWIELAYMFLRAMTIEGIRGAS